MTVWLSGASGASVVIGILCAWRLLHAPQKAATAYERIAGFFLWFGLTGLGTRLATFSG